MQLVNYAEHDLHIRGLEKRSVTQVGILRYAAAVRRTKKEEKKK